MRAPADLTGAVSAIEGLLDSDYDADDVLRAVVRMLHDRAGLSYVAIAFVEEGEVVVGPRAGEEQPAVVTFPVAFQGEKIAELRVAPAGAEAREPIERIASLISPLCLVGWDTGGVPWADLS